MASILTEVEGQVELLRDWGAGLPVADIPGLGRGCSPSQVPTRAEGLGPPDVEEVLHLLE